MSETESEAQGQNPKISRLAIGEIVAPVIVCLLIIAILWSVLVRLSEYDRRSRCEANLVTLGKSMVIYASRSDDKYPTPDEWCDLLVEHTEVGDKEFVCPSAGEGRCHYAMNPNAKMTGPTDRVLLFETKGGWNQYGGPEILTFENHKGRGCNIWFNSFQVELVKPKQLGELNWEDEGKE